MKGSRVCFKFSRVFFCRRISDFFENFDSCCDGFLLQGICWLVFFFRVDQVNSKYRSSHPSLTDSRLSLGINCNWYRTRHDRHRGGYDSAHFLNLGQHWHWGWDSSGVLRNKLTPSHHGLFSTNQTQGGFNIFFYFRDLYPSFICISICISQ